MLAKELVEEYGDNLMGKWVLVCSTGDFPGGFYEVVFLNLEEDTPGIAFYVECDYDGFGAIGILDEEPVALMITCDISSTLH